MYNEKRASFEKAMLGQIRKDPPCIATYFQHKLCPNGKQTAMLAAKTPRETQGS